MANLNRIILIGRLVSDPDAKFTIEGLPMTKFKLAVDRFHKEGTPQAVDIVDVVAWRQLAEVCGEHLKKGNLALVEGCIQVRSFQDQSGQKKWTTEVVARNMQMLDKQTAVFAQKSEEAAAIAEAEEEIPVEEDDLPF